MAGLIRSFVDACQVLDSERYTDSRLHAGTLQAVDAVISSLRRHAAWQIKEFNDIWPPQGRLLGYRWWNAGSTGGDVVAYGGDVWFSGVGGAGRGNADRWQLRGRGVERRLLAATLGPSGNVAAGLMDFGGFGVTLPGASAKRSRLLPENVDCSLVGRMLSPRDRAIIRDINESVFALMFLETGYWSL